MNGDRQGAVQRCMNDCEASATGSGPKLAEGRFRRNGLGLYDGADEHGTDAEAHDEQATEAVEQIHA
jgi:hypothetical protein